MDDTTSGNTTTTEDTTDPIVQLSKSYHLESVEAGYLISPDYRQSSYIPYRPLSYYGNKVKELGKGTYGSVALYAGTHGEYAIKKMLISDSDGIEATILRELSCLISLSHPNIIKLIDIIPSLTAISYVMPAALSDLVTYLDHNPSMASRKYIIYQVLCAFSYLASADILHRDLKPQNVLVFENDLIKIADFGLARPTGCIYSKGFTKGVFTLWYRPIELLLKDVEGYDISADVWSIGCLIYEIYTGKPLFPGKDVSETKILILEKLGTDSPEARKEIRSLSSPEMLNLLAKYPKYSNKLESELSIIQDYPVADLILDCLKYDPSRRSTPYQLLRSKYFDDIRNEELEYEPTSCMGTFLQREWYPSDDLVDQPELSAKRRIVLLEIAFNLFRIFKLTARTYFATVFLIDWGITKLNIKLRDSKLYAIVCSNIAAKYCEVYAPNIRSYLDISGTAHTMDDFLDMESRLLRVFSYDLHFAVSYDYRVESSFNQNDFSFEDMNTAVINKLLLIAITFTSVRFMLLPSEQFRLGSVMAKAMVRKDYKILEKWIPMAKQLKEEILLLKIQSLEDYVQLKSVLGKSFYEMVENLNI